MSVLQEFMSRRGSPPPPPLAVGTATSLRLQPIEEVDSPARNPLHWINQSQALAQPVPVGSPLRGFDQLYVFDYERAKPPFLDGMTQVVNAPRQSEYAGELLYSLLDAAYRGAPEHPTSKLLEQSYVLEDRSEIPAFIKRNRLLEHLLAARVPLASAFGEASLKKLTLVEDDEGFVTLFCLILFPGSLEQARQELSSFDESWWLAHSHEADGKLNFDFELI